jgi:hypothetical protein
MIFLGLVVLWLLILVPAVARHRQEVARPTTAALSGRVLDRPRRAPERGRHGSGAPARAGSSGAGEVEVNVTEHEEPQRSVAVADVERPPLPEPDRAWERPAARYRRGRGGYDPEAAALAAKARYAFRQRVVLAMLISIVVTAVAAAVVAPGIWWAHASVDVALVGYLVYLRRQVRLEEVIRQRRAARMAGTRRPSAAEDPELDEWARRGRAALSAGPRVDLDEEIPTRHDEEPLEDREADDEHDDLTREPPERVSGTGAPLWRAPGLGLEMMEVESALPRMPPVPPPPLPAGTALVEADPDDPDLHDLDEPARPDYRRAAGE